MLSIYQKGIVEEICKSYCEGIQVNGKIILKGMVQWIEERINKYCSSEKEAVKELKSKLTTVKVKEILETQPDKLIDIWNEFKIYENLKKDDDDSNTILENIFHYETFRSYRSTIINGYWLAQELGVDCCPYCNRNYTMSHKHNYDSDYPFMHLLYSQLLFCQRVCLQNTVCLICK